jgi:creatinine amidohydrolase
VAITGRVYDVSRLTADEIRALERNQTIVLLPVGNLENHGPHLVIGTDTLMIKASLEYISREIVRRLPDWAILLFPAFEFGTQPIDELTVGASTFSGASFLASSATLRNLVAEIGHWIASSGFRYIAVLTRHGGPLHINSIELACQFISEKHHVKMQAFRLRTTRALIDKANTLAGNPFTKEEINQFENEIHAGCLEVSWMLHIHPELVKNRYRALESKPIKNYHEAKEVARRPDFNYYFGWPNRARSDFGAKLVKVIEDDCIMRIITSVVNESEDSSLTQRRVAVKQDNVNARQLDREEQFQKDFDSWLEQAAGKGG